MPGPIDTLVLATQNPAKVAELAALLDGRGIRLVSAADIPGAPDVEETEDTLAGNATLKSQALYALTGLPSLADDTGLLVDALDGAPGVYSARFAGPNHDDVANRALLLQKLDGVDDRAAHFETVLALTTAEGTEVFSGICEGRIAQEERGTGGFGYDALFVPDDGDGRHFAEMARDEKGHISHRGRALRAFVDSLRDRS